MGANQIQTNIKGNHENNGRKNFKRMTENKSDLAYSTKTI